jgi:low temperature requirement protein LtrA
MPAMTPKVLRTPAALGSPPQVRVTNLELFFDLVYVFAITQLSEFLYDNQTARGALEALILFSAVWWAWNYTAWATNWIDPDQPATALVMIVLMALGLFMAAALPEAFGGRGAPFAIAYVALQLARTGIVAAAFPASDPMRANNLRLLAWLSLGGAIWILGAYLHGDARLIVWLVAVALELSAPLHGFRLPRGHAIPIERWRLSGIHLAERYQLVLMIALGESVLRVGLTASDNPGSVTRDTAFIAGFLLSAALWAAYFLRLAEAGAERVASASEGRAARVGRGYAYAHASMVAGVIVVAVAVQSAIHDPESPATIASTLVILGGPALFLAGLAAFQRSARLGAAARPLIAIGVLALLVLPALAGANQLVLVICVTGVLLALASWLTLAPPRSWAG